MFGVALGRQRYEFTARAVVDTSLLVIQKNHLFQILALYPAASDELRERAGGKLADWHRAAATATDPGGALPPANPDSGAILNAGYPLPAVAAGTGAAGESGR